MLKQLLLEALNRQQEFAQAYQTHIVDLNEQIKLLRDRLFGRKSEQTVEPNTPQPALFNEPESEPMPSVGDAGEEVVERTSRRGKRNPLSADLPRIEIIHELPEHCSGLMKPDTHLGENARPREVSDDQATPYLYP